MRIPDFMYSFVRQKASNQLLFAQPSWFKQTVADLKRHEGFYEYSYPDPLSPLAKKYPIARYWGRRSAASILRELKETEARGRPWTVGYGATQGVTPDTHITELQATRRLEQELMEHVIYLDALIPQWKSYPDVIQGALANLIYNLGPDKLAKFTTTLALIKAQKFAQAGENLKKTLWYKQVGHRGRELTERLITGKIRPEHQV